MVGELVTNDDDNDNDDDLLPDDIVDIMQTVDLDTDTLMCFVHIRWHYIELDFLGSFYTWFDTWDYFRHGQWPMVFAIVVTHM